MMTTTIGEIDTVLHRAGISLVKAHRQLLHELWLAES
jgi:hypothetical protein